MSAYELAAELELTLGRPADVVDALTPLVASEPLREPLRASLMLALYRTGRQADALRLYAEGREVLGDQLGADPDPAVQQLHERILRQDPTLDPAPVTTTPEPSAVPPPAGGERLVGRTAELSRLTGLLERTASGATEFAAIVGEAGIGKSRLAEEVSGRARAVGQLVAWGRCWQHEGAPALWPWIQVLRELGAKLPDSVLGAASEGRAAAVLTLVPELHPGAQRSAGMASSVEDVEVRIFDAVIAFLEIASRHRPVLLVIDDLQWADPVSRRLAEYAATHLTGPVAVLCTVRSPGHDQHHPDLEVLAALARLTRVQRLDLAPLSEPDVRTLVVDRIGDEVDEPTALALHARTGGNPFFIGEIVRLVLTPDGATTMVDGVPDSVRGVIRQRVQRLPETDQAVLHAAAVVGRTFDIDVIAAVTGIDADDVDEAVDRATSVGILQSEPGTADQHRFHHALLQETLLDEVGPSRRKRLHRRVALALQDRRASRGPVAGAAVRIAHHHAAAGSPEDLERAVEFQLLAVDDALTDWRYPEVEPLLSEAITWCDRAGTAHSADLALTVRYRLSAFYLLFDGAYSAERRWQLVAGTEHVSIDALSSRDLVTLLHTRWGNDHGQGLLGEGGRSTDLMLRAAEERDDDLLRVAGHLTRGYEMLQRGRFDDAETALARVEELSGRMPIPRLVFTPDPRVAAPLWRALTAIVRGQTDRAHELFDVGARRSRELGDPVTEVYVDGIDVYRWVWLRDAERAAAAAEVSMRSVVTHDMGMMRMYMSIPVAWAVARADLHRGLGLADEAMRSVDAPAGLVWRPMLQGMYAEILLWAGRLDEALARADRGLAEARATGAAGHLASLHRVRAEVLRARGADPAEVATVVAAGLAVARAHGASLFAEQLSVVDGR